MADIFVPPPPKLSDVQTATLQYRTILGALALALALDDENHLDIPWNDLPRRVYEMQEYMRMTNEMLAAMMRTQQRPKQEPS